MIKELIGHDIPTELNPADRFEDFSQLMASHEAEFEAKAREMGFNIPVDTVWFREQDLAPDGQIPTHFLIKTVGITDRSVLEEHDINFHPRSIAELAEGCLSLVILYKGLSPNSLDPDTSLEEFLKAMMQSKARMHMLEGSELRIR